MSTSSLVIRRYGNIIDISPDGNSPTPEHVVDMIAPALTYTHRQMQVGLDAIDQVTGEHRPVKITKKRLYRTDSKGRLVTGAGYIPKLLDFFTARNIEVRYADLSPLRERKYAFQPHWDLVYNNVTFRAPEQEECLHQIHKYESGIVDAAPAFGKSFMFAAIALLYPKAKILCLTKSADVVSRLHRGLLKFIPGVGRIGGGKKSMGRVTVCTSGSMHHAGDDWDFVLCDEVHQLMSEKTVDSLSTQFKFSRMWGFTGTVERFDNAHERMECLFGPTRFYMPWQACVDAGLILPMVVKWHSVPGKFDPAKDRRSFVAKKRWALWQNHDRNKIVADVAHSHGDDEQVLLMVETVEHMVNLRRFLPDFEMCYSNMKPNDRDRYIRSGQLDEYFEPMTSDRRDRLSTDFEAGKLKKVIATDVWSVGVDFPKLQNIIRADARSSMELMRQIPGRTARLDDDDKTHGILHDFRDEFSTSFKKAAQGRSRAYKKEKWEQEFAASGKRQIAGVPYKT